MSYWEAVMLIVIMGVVYLQLYLVMLWSALSLVNEKRSIYFGLNLTLEQRQDAAIVAVIEKYRKNLRRFFLVAGLCIVPAIWPQPYMAITFSILMLYLTAIFVIPARSAVLHGEEIKSIKLARGWYQPQLPSVLVDIQTSRAIVARRVGLEWYLIAGVLSLLPLTAELGDPGLRWIMTISSITVTVLLYGVALGLLKGRNKVYTLDSELNTQLNSALKRDLCWCLACVAMLQALLNSGLLWALSDGTPLGLTENVALFTFIVLSSAVPLAGAGAIYLRQRHRLDELLGDGEAQLYEERFTEDERYWYGGLFYHNPHNPKVFVSSTRGMQTAVNLGTKAGRRMTWATLVLVMVILLPLWCLIVVDELEPFHWKVSDGVVRLDNSIYRTRFELDEILEVSLVESAQLTGKRSGSATERYAIGYFNSSLHGPVKVYLIRGSLPIIKVVLTDEVLLVATEAPEETMALFRQLGGELK